MAPKPDNFRQNAVEIDRWIERGEFSDGLKNTRDILDDADDLLDASNASEIVGPGVYFLGKDGNVYAVNVEVVIYKCSAKEAEEALAS